MYHAGSQAVNHDTETRVTSGNFAVVWGSLFTFTNRLTAGSVAAFFVIIVRVFFSKSNAVKTSSVAVVTKFGNAFCLYLLQIKICCCKAHLTTTGQYKFLFDIVWTVYYFTIYVVGSKIFRPDIQKPRQMENAVKDI